jgi:hypothetical protein
MQDVILSACSFDEECGDNEADDRRNDDDENTFIDVEYRHGDLEEADLMMMTTTATDRYDGGRGDE